MARSSSEHSSIRESAHFYWSTSSKDHLGSGATGSVYKGIWKLSGEIVAVKSYNTNNRMTRSQAVRSREVTVMETVKDHKNIVKLFKIEEEFETTATILVMEYCNAGSLMSVLEEPEHAIDGMCEEEFRRVLGDVTDGLRYLRRCGVTHRDLKPGNILRHYDDFGRCLYKITDFGSARELEEDEMFQSICGTYEYLHPKILSGVLRHSSDKSYSSVVDLWSFGVTLYQCATGRLPFIVDSGRKDLHGLYRAITGKGERDISAVQVGGRFRYSSELSKDCKLPRSFQEGLCKILRAVLQVDDRRAASFDDFFFMVQGLLNSKRVNVYDITTCTYYEVLVHPTHRVGSLVQEVDRCLQATPSRSDSQHQRRVQSLWCIPQAGQEVYDFALPDHRDKDIPTSSISQLLVLESGIWLDKKSADFHSLPRGPESIDDDFRYSQKVINWGHNILHRIQQLKTTAQSIDRAANAIWAIHSKRLSAVRSSCNQTDTLYKGLEKVWLSVSRILDPEVEGNLKILKMLQIDTSESNKVLGSVQERVKQINSAFAMIGTDHWARCVKLSNLIDKPGEVFQWNATDQLKAITDSEQEVRTLLERMASIKRKFYSDKRLFAGHTTSYDGALHKSERRRLDRIALELQAKSRSCSETCNSLWSRQKDMWRACDEHIHTGSVQDLRQAVAEYSQVVKKQEQTITSLLTESESFIAKQRSDVLSHVHVAVESSSTSNQALAVSMDGDSRRKMEQLYQLFAQLQQSYLALQQEARLNSTLSRKVTVGKG